MLRVLRGETLLRSPVAYGRGRRPRRGTIAEEITDQEAHPSEASAVPFEGVARQATIRFTGLAVDKMLGFAFALFVAKTYGSTAFGLYLFGVGMFEILYALTELGLERATIRAVANAAARGRPADARGAVRTTLSIIVPFGTLVATVVFITAPWLSALLGRPDLASFLQLGAIAIPAALVADALLWATEGLGSQRWVVGIRMVLEPIIKIAVAAALFGPYGDHTEAEPLAVAYAAAVVTSAALAIMVYRLVVAPRTAGAPRRVPARDLLSVSLPVCALVLVMRLLAWWDVFLIFTFVSSIATTHYTVGVRTATLTTMIAAAFDAAFRPRLAAALAVGRHDAVAHEFQLVARTVLMLCLPACAMLIVFPHLITPVLGEQFTAATGVVAIVAMGTVASFTTGPAASALVMAGQSRIPLANGMIGGAVGVVVGLALVGPLGPIGVALGQCSSITVSNVLHAVAAHRKLGVLGIGPNHLRLAGAIAVAVAAGLAAEATGIESKYAAFVAVGTAVVLAYGAALVAFRVPREDWELLGGALRLLKRKN